MKQIYIILIPIFVLTATSCKNEKDALISKYEQLVEKASMEYTHCNEDSWKRINDDFKKLDKQYARLEKKMSAQDIEKIHELKGRFYSITVKYEALRLKKILKDGYNKAKGFIHDFFDDQ